MTGPEPLVPGGRYAAQIRQLDPPDLRSGYPGGVVVNAFGLPEWDLLARAVVALPPVEPALTVDETRILDVLTGNEVMVLAGDPLWADTADDYVAATPPGWVWTHLWSDRPGPRRVALVPADVHAAFRHAGGMALGRWDRSRRGVTVDDATPVPMDFAEELDEGLVRRVEARLGHPLPGSYRTFLARTNGAMPGTPAIHPDHGFLADQPFFGVRRDEPAGDVLYANQWFRDRFTDDFLAIGHVQGGLLAVRVAGGDTGSIWYWDDDDPRDDDRYDAGYICDHLLHRLAGDFDDFWNALAVTPRRLLELVDSTVSAGRARQLDLPDLGASLPADLRAPA